MENFVRFAVLFLVVFFVAWGVLKLLFGRTKQSIHSNKPELISSVAIPNYQLPASPASSAPQPPPQDSERDGLEETFWDAASPKSLKKDILLSYVDAAGRSSNRVVSLRAFDDQSDMFTGYCHLRGGTRSFRFSRIVSCADAHTGELIDDFKSFCVKEYATTANYSIDRLVGENLDALQVAFFVGRRDGRITQKELTELASYASEIIRDNRINAELMRTVFDNLGEPSITAFRRAVGRLKLKDFDYKKNLVSACRAMVATEVKISGSEQEALDYLDKHLLTGSTALRSPRKPSQ